MSETTGGIADILEKVAAEDHAEPEQRREVTPPPEPRHESQDDTEAVADKLRRDLAAQTQRTQAAEQARVEAEQRARTATAEVQQTRQSAADANFTTVLTALEARNREMESVTAQIADAGEKGDFKRIAELSAQAGRIGAALEGLENAKQEMERQRQDRLREPPKSVAPPEPARDPTTIDGISREQFIQQNRVASNVADWLRTEGDAFFTDPAFRQRCVAADSLNKADGIAPTDPRYLVRVKEILGMTDQPAPRPQRQSSSPPASAPPSRSTPTLSGRAPANGGDVYISPEVRRVAEWLEVDPAEYTAEQDRLRRSGELPHRRR